MNLVRRLGLAILAFARWYWRRVRELPTACLFFALGSGFGSLVTSSPGIAKASFTLGRAVVKAVVS